MDGLEHLGQLPPEGRPRGMPERTCLKQDRPWPSSPAPTTRASQDLELVAPVDLHDRWPEAPVGADRVPIDRSDRHATREAGLLEQAGRARAHRTRQAGTPGRSPLRRWHRARRHPRRENRAGRSSGRGGPGSSCRSRAMLGRPGEARAATGAPQVASTSTQGRPWSAPAPASITAASRPAAGGDVRITARGAPRMSLLKTGLQVFTARRRALCAVRSPSAILGAPCASLAHGDPALPRLDPFGRGNSDPAPGVRVGRR